MRITGRAGPFRVSAGRGGRFGLGLGPVWLSGGGRRQHRSRSARKSKPNPWIWYFTAVLVIVFLTRSIWFVTVPILAVVTFAIVWLAISVKRDKRRAVTRSALYQSLPKRSHAGFVPKADAAAEAEPRVLCEMRLAPEERRGQHGGLVYESDDGVQVEVLLNGRIAWEGSGEITEGRYEMVSFEGATVQK